MKPRISSVITFGILLLTVMGAASGVAAMPAPQGTIGADVPAPQTTEELAPEVAPQATQHWLSIPAAAFAPFEDGYDYQNHARYLLHLHSPGNGNLDGLYVAPVELPVGATVNRVIFSWYDNSSSKAGTAYLQRTQLFGAGLDSTYWTMASVSTNDSHPGFYTSEATGIASPVIQADYGYWVAWWLPISTAGSHPGVGDVMGKGMMIGYTLPGSTSYLPTLRK